MAAARGVQGGERGEAGASRQQTEASKQGISNQEGEQAASALHRDGNATGGVARQPAWTALPTTSAISPLTSCRGSSLA